MSTFKVFQGYKEANGVPHNHGLKIKFFLCKLKWNLPYSHFFGHNKSSYNLFS